MSAVSCYQTIVLLPANALAALPPPHLEVRQHRAGSLLAATLATLLAIASAPLAFAWYRAGMPLWEMLLTAGCASGLYGWISLRKLPHPSAPADWVLREDGTHLLVNLHPHPNARFDPFKPSVLVLPRNRVRSLTVARRHGLSLHAGRHRPLFADRAGGIFLDIAFDGEREPVSAAIAGTSASRRKRCFDSFLLKQGAVSMLPGNVLRVTWRDERNRLHPELEQLRYALAGRYRFLENAETHVSIKPLDRAEQETRLLEMVARGERLQAIALAKVLYGMATEEATDFIDGLK